jgi:glycerophosphoryl diester phosphodiesterase
MKVIGHRGAAGLALENTAASFKRALELKVTIIELDVRLTSDKILVVAHDADLKRIANDPRKINDCSWDELSEVMLNDGSQLLKLEDVLNLCKNVQVLVELKDKDSEHALLPILDKFPKSDLVVISFNLTQLINLKKLRPDLPLYLSERTKAIENIQFARKNGFNGVMMNFWILSPIAYLLARRAKLTVCVYTVNNLFFAKFLHFFYPQVQICTDYPNKLMPHKSQKQGDKS